MDPNQPILSLIGILSFVITVWAVLTLAML